MGEINQGKAIQNKDRLTQSKAVSTGSCVGPPSQMRVKTDDHNWTFYFPRDSYSLLESHKPVLNNIKEQLIGDQQFLSEIYGHASTDAPKNDTQYNQTLSEKRSLEVVKFLFPDEEEREQRALWAGKGTTEASSESGLTPGTEEKLRGLNRRVTVLLKDSPAWRVSWLKLKKKVNEAKDRLAEKSKSYQLLEEKIKVLSQANDVQDLGGAACAEVIQTVEDLRVQMLFVESILGKLNSVKNQKDWIGYKTWFQQEHSGVKRSNEKTIESSKNALQKARDQLEAVKNENPQNPDRIKFWENVVEDLDDSYKSIIAASRDILEEEK